MFSSCIYNKILSRNIHKISWRTLSCSLSQTSSHPKVSNDKTDDDIASDSTSDPCPENYDIFGVESDKDAICFEDKPVCLEKFSHLFSKKNGPKEIVLVTSFGAVRPDAWNPLSYRSDNFPESDSPHLDSKGISQKQSNSKSVQHKISTASSTGWQSGSKSAISDLRIFKSNTERNSMNNRKNDASYLDDAYFGSAVFDDRKDSSYTQEKTLSSPESTSKIVRSSRQSLDEQTVCTTEPLEKENYFDGNEGKVNYIDDVYFGSLLNENSKISVDTCEKENIETGKNSPPEQFTSNVEEKSEINRLLGNDVPSNIDSFSLTENIQPSDLNLQSTKDMLKSDDFLSEIDKQYFGEVLKEDSDADFNRKLQEINHKENFEDDVINEQVMQDKNNPSFEVTNNFIADQNLSDVAMWTKPDLSVEIDVEESSLESDLKDMTSAKNFVSKLRKKHLKTQIDEKGELILPSETVQDSKGFRILKYQVPDLSDLTRDEFLLLLKNRILYSNDDLLIIDKPYNLVIHDAETNKDPSLSQLLDEFARMIDKKSPDPKLYTVHRIGKETTGCFILARNEYTAAQIKALFAQRKILKKYWVVTSRVPKHPEGMIDIPISEGFIDKKSRMVLSPEIPKDLPYKSFCKKGKKAITHYRVISTSGNAALIEVVPETETSK